MKQQLSLEWGRVPLRVGVVSTGRGLGWLAAAGRCAEAGCDVVEVRLDYLLAARVGLERVHRALAGREVPVLLTLRDATEGGQLEMSSAMRRAVLEPLLPCCEAVDVEAARYAGLRALVCGRSMMGSGADRVQTVSRTTTKKPGAKVARKPAAEVESAQDLSRPATEPGLILSAHFFGKYPGLAALKKLLTAMHRVREAAVYKVAVHCDGEREVQELAELQLAGLGRVALMGMGPGARRSRVVLPLLGSRLVYGFLDAATAPGQERISKVSARLSELSVE